MTSPSGNRDQPAEKLQSHIIMRGSPKKRAALVDRLKKEGLELKPHLPTTKLPEFHRFNPDIPQKPVEGKTFDKIKSPYALYTFDPAQLGLKSDASCEEQDKQLKERIDLVNPQTSKQYVPVYRDWLITGIETVISGTGLGDANEGPGISPSGLPRWLEPEISSALSRKPAPMDGGADTAIVILDTAPGDLTQWDSQDKLVDGYADFTPLLLRDNCRDSWFTDTIKKTDVRTRMAITEKMHEDRQKGVENHGLMVAALCRDNAPKDTRLILLRVQDNNGIGTVHALCSAMYYALALREQEILPKKLIFNLSLGLPASDRSGIDSHRLLEAIAHVVNEPDITFVVCAAGDINPSFAVKQRVDEGSTNPSSTVEQRVDGGDTNPSDTKKQRIDAEEPAAYYRIESELKATRRSDEQLMNEAEIRRERERYDIRPERFEQRLLCVGATDQSRYTDGASIGYAPFSKKADLAAPGMDLLLRTREPGEFGKPGRDSYLIWSGASFATPQVSGLVARMLTGKDEDAADLVHEVLKGTGKPIKDPAVSTTPSAPGVLREEEPSVQPPAADVPPQIDPDRALAELEGRMHHKRGSSQSDQGKQNGTQNNGAQERERRAAAGLAHTPSEEHTLT